MMSTVPVPYSTRRGQQKSEHTALCRTRTYITRVKCSILWAPGHVYLTPPCSKDFKLEGTRTLKNSEDKYVALFPSTHNCIKMMIEQLMTKGLGESISIIIMGWNIK